VSGWGIENGSSNTPKVSQNLRFSDLSFISDEKCRRRATQLPSHTLCAVGGERTACSSTATGDPLVCLNRLVGLHARSSTESCRDDTPGFYTSIPFYRQWILNLLNGGTPVEPTTIHPRSTIGSAEPGVDIKGTTDSVDTQPGVRAAFAGVVPDVIGSNNARPGQFPYQVSVRDSKKIQDHNHVCGGVLIGYSEVLTAASCVK